MTFQAGEYFRFKESIIPIPEVCVVTSVIMYAGYRTLVVNYAFSPYSKTPINAKFPDSYLEGEVVRLGTNKELVALLYDPNLPTPK